MQASALWSAHSAQDDGFNAFVLAEMGIHVSDAGDTTARVKLINTVTQRSAGSTALGDLVPLPPPGRGALQEHPAQGRREVP